MCTLEDELGEYGKLNEDLEMKWKMKMGALNEL